MGTGWSYLINVCQSLRVLIGLVISVIGCILVYVVYSVVTQQMQAANPTPLVVTQPGGAAPLAPGAGNPQFATQSGPPAPPQQPGETPQQPIGNGPAVNPQFGMPARTVPASPSAAPAQTGTPGLIPGPPPGGAARNPQFGR